MKEIFLTTLFGMTLWGFLWMGGIFAQTHLPHPGEKVTLYSNQTGGDLKGMFLQAINEANESIILFIYSMRDRSIIKALQEKQNSGIDVTIICDPNASNGVEKHLKVHKRRGKGLMHNKILVIDQERVWVGSANMTTQSLKMHGNLVAGLYSPPLAAFIAQKADAMIRTGYKRHVTNKKFTVADQPIEMWFLPDSTHGVAKITKMLRSAKKTIKVAMFTWTRMDLAQELIDAKARGVVVEVAIDQSAGKGVGNRVVKLLEEGDIPVQFNKGAALLHHKFLIIDDDILINGSANWTKAAFGSNEDCFLIIKDLTPEQAAKLNKLWKVIDEV